jgi:uncharacterized glyoxalase superfamily protein PhnB/DNA-binding XRE family transcriptional regulator
MDETREMGEKIRALRDRKAWTQQHLADAARISPRTVQRAEEGVMSAETRTAIAGALDVPVESLSAAAKPWPARGWPRITPTLLYEDSKAAIAWLEQAFGFQSRVQVPGPGGQIVHAELTLDDGVVMVGHVSWSPSADGHVVSPKSLGKTTASLFVFVDDLDAHYARAKGAGAMITQEIQSAYGFRRYRARDVEGHEWCFAVKTGE